MFKLTVIGIWVGCGAVPFLVSGTSTYHDTQFLVAMSIAGLALAFCGDQVLGR